MNIIWYILGIASGLGFKLVMDKYHQFKTEEEKRANRMEDLLVEWQAIAKIKELEK